MAMRLPLILAAVALLCGCQRVTDADKQAAIECVRANLAAMEKGDPEAAATTIHPQSPAFAEARRQTEAILQFYRLKMELESASIGRVTPDGIEVNFVQVTRKIEGPEEFIDNRVEGTHLLRRDGAAWKIWSTRSNAARTLDGQPLFAR
jgi:hypothetical protein